MKKLLTSLIFILLLVIPISVHCQTNRDGTEYVSTETIVFAWDASSNIEYYEVKAVWIDPTNEFEYDLGSTTETQILINRLRTGHFKYKVRACNTEECSEWSESTDLNRATVDTQPKGWWVFWKVPPPTGPIIK